jgi:hypothetical protein
MARGPQGVGDGDDWFSDVELQGMLESDPATAEDDWLVQPEPVRRPAGQLQWRRIAVIAGAAVVVLVAGLAAGGVFSGSSKPRTLATNSITVTTPTTTAAAPAVAAALPTTTLKPGDTGAQVRALQRALKSLGYPVGKIDGQYGPATKTAVAAFQHAAGLTEDGVVGPKTLNALIHRAGP